MITPKLFSESRERVPFAEKHALFNPSFFRGEWKRSWPKTLCYALLLFFVLPLPLLFQLNSRGNWEAQRLYTRMAEDLADSILLYVFAAMAIAVFAGMLATYYLMRRVSVDFYHSLPMRREGLLIHFYAVGIFNFLPALIIDTVLSLLVLATQFSAPAYLGRLFLIVLWIAGQMLLTFLFFYTLTVFCGMLCGTSSMQVMLTGLVLGWFPLGLAMVLAFLNEHTSNIDIGYYFEQNWSWTSPFMRVCYLMEHPLAWWEALLAIAATAVLLALSLWVYRLRRVERAGMPIVFGVIAKIVKWVVMVLATLAMGLLFTALGDGGFFWRFFGFVLGGFLSFLLINTILTKNPKQMFDGWVRMLIYVVAFCIGYVGVALGVTVLDGYVPKNVSAVTISFSGESYDIEAYRDPAVIEAWEELWEVDPLDNAYRTMESDYYGNDVAVEYGDIVGNTPKTYFFYQGVGSSTINIRSVVHVGPFRLAFRNRVYYREEAESLLRAIADSEEFEQGYRVLLERAAENVFSNGYKVDEEKTAEVTLDSLVAAVYHDDFAVYRNYDYDLVRFGTDHNRPLESGMAAKIIADLTAGDICFDRFQTSTYAEMSCWGVERVGESGTRVVNVSIGMNMPTLGRELGIDEEELFGKMADMILAEVGYVLVAKHTSYAFSAESEGVMRVEDRAQIIEILKGLSRFSGHGAAISDFVVTDAGYGVAIPESGYDHVLYFIKGKVPAFVTATLG